MTPEELGPSPPARYPATMKSHFILYVADQAASTAFYRTVLDVEPRLNVPGMSEFVLGPETVLGLMPEASIRRLLGERLPDPATARGVPRSEVYLVVDDPARYHRRACEAGGTELSPVESRDWGDDVGYSLDPDGHVVAFARTQ